MTKCPAVPLHCMTEAQMRLVSMTLQARGELHIVERIRPPLALVKGGPGR